MRLIPREKKFFHMFTEVSGNLTEGARLLYGMLKNPVDLDSRTKQLQEVEHRGDELTHNIIRMLNQTFITPFDREDIHRLTSSLDDVLDFVNAAAVRMTLYKITSPPAAAGIPVSTTHTITGAIVGVGAVHRLSAVRWGVARRIVWAWILTIPASAVVAGLVFWVMRLFNPGA